MLPDSLQEASPAWSVLRQADNFGARVCARTMVSRGSHGIGSRGGEVVGQRARGRGGGGARGAHLGAAICERLHTACELGVAGDRAAGSVSYSGGVSHGEALGGAVVQEE